MLIHYTQAFPHKSVGSQTSLGLSALARKPKRVSHALRFLAWFLIAKEAHFLHMRVQLPPDRPIVASAALASQRH